MAKKTSRERVDANGGGNQALLPEELRSIKALLMVLALKIGASTNELGAALGVSGQRIRQMIPASEIKNLNLNVDSGAAD